MRIRMIQMDMELGAPEKNFTHAREMIRLAAAEGCDVITLPETWNVGFFPREDPEQLADREGRQVKEMCSALAKEFRVNIVAGSVANGRETAGSLTGKAPVRGAEGTGGRRLYNTAFVFDRAGALIAEYDKVHLFSPDGENDFFTPGDRPCNFELDGIPCSLVICYDIRFPELIRSEMLKGSVVQFVSAQWPETRILHWDVLNRARAIENQCFLCCTNSVGRAGAVQYGGHSAVYGPGGECLVLGGGQEEILTAEIDPAEAEELRGRINVYRDRRPEVYEL